MQGMPSPVFTLHPECPPQSISECASLEYSPTLDSKSVCRTLYQTAAHTLSMAGNVFKPRDCSEEPFLILEFGSLKSMTWEWKGQGTASCLMPQACVVLCGAYRVHAQSELYAQRLTGRPCRNGHVGHHWSRSVRVLLAEVAWLWLKMPVNFFLA